MSIEAHGEIADLLDSWWRAEAAWLALDGFVLSRLEVPDVLNEAAEALFAIEISAAVRLREMGVGSPNPVWRILQQQGGTSMSRPRGRPPAQVLTL